MNLQKVTLCFCLCTALLTLPGCALRKTQTQAEPDAVAAQQPALLFSEQVAAMPEGATQYFAESPFGPVTVDAGGHYLSGLGHECRSVRVSRVAMSQKLVLCKGAKGGWGFVPTIYESMPL